MRERHTTFDTRTFAISYAHSSATNVAAKFFRRHHRDLNTEATIRLETAAYRQNERLFELPDRPTDRTAMLEGNVFRTAVKMPSAPISRKFPGTENHRVDRSLRPRVRGLQAETIFVPIGARIYTIFNADKFQRGRYRRAGRDRFMRIRPLIARTQRICGRSEGVARPSRRIRHAARLATSLDVRGLGTCQCLGPPT